MSTSSCGLPIKKPPAVAQLYSDIAIDSGVILPSRFALILGWGGRFRLSDRDVMKLRGQL